MLDLVNLAESLRTIADLLDKAQEEAEPSLESSLAYIRENGVGDIVSEFSTEVIDYVLSYNEDEVIDQLRSNGSIPDVDTDELRYAVSRVREAADGVEECLR